MHRILLPTVLHIPSGVKSVGANSRAPGVASLNMTSIPTPTSLDTVMLCDGSSASLSPDHGPCPTDREHRAQGPTVAGGSARRHHLLRFQTPLLGLGPTQRPTRKARADSEPFAQREEARPPARLLSDHGASGDIATGTCCIFLAVCEANAVDAASDRAKSCRSTSSPRCWMLSRRRFATSGIFTASRT